MNNLPLHVYLRLLLSPILAAAVLLAIMYLVCAIPEKEDENE